MKLHSNITINGKKHSKGSTVRWLSIYPFFMIHMLMFGGSGFLMAYSGEDIPVYFLYMHGGIAITVYIVFYITIFGLDEVKWMFINAGLSILGIFSQIGWLLSFVGKELSDFPYYIHVIPFLYFVLYTFLLRQAVLDLTNSRDNEKRKRIVETAYVLASVAFYLFI